MRAIIVACEYNGKYYLPGIRRDLEQVIEYAKRWNIQPIIFTDVWKLNYSPKQLPELFASFFVPEEDHYFLYFTGHGTEENEFLLTADGKTWPFSEVEKVLFRLPHTVQVCWVNDCCHLHMTGLPYHINEYGKYEDWPATFCPSQNIRLFASASPQSKSFTTVYGSPFTSAFFTILPNMKTMEELYQTLVQHLPSPPVIFSSYQETSLWPWVQNNFQLASKWQPPSIITSNPVSKPEIYIPCWTDMPTNGPRS